MVNGSKPMSPHAANSLVHDLVEMAKAFEELPFIRAQLLDAEAISKRDGETIARLELRIMELKITQDELNAKIARLEVERDDASFRELVAIDRGDGAVAALKTIFSSVGETLKALQPEPKVEPVVEQYREQARPLEFSTPSPVEAEPIGSQGSTQVSGESAADPIADPVPQTGTETVSEASSSEQSTHGPYYGLRYHNVPVFITYWDWIEGGGTEADYHWRPSHTAQSF